MNPLKIEVGEGVRNYSSPAKSYAAPVEQPSPDVVEEAKEANDDAKGEQPAQGQSRQEPEPVVVQEPHVVTYSVDKTTHEVVAKIVDAESGEVVRELPPESLRKVQAALKELSKKIFDKIA